MNIFDYAMQMELDGQAFYERLAADAQAEGLKSIFSSMAVDESKHYDLFKQMKEASATLSMVDSTALDGAKNFFTELQKQGTALSPDTKSLEAYRYAMQVEADSATLYREAAEKETNQAIRELLLRIANEERKHLNILENVFEFVNAPNQSLVWGEFSNLKEF
jgi:rubrerythrin